MKRNLLSIIILALLVINLVLTSIMMINVSSASQKTAALVGDIAEVLNLELSDNTGSGKAKSNVPMEDIEVYKIADQMTIPLAIGDDGEPHFCLVSVAFSMDTKNEGYKTYGDLSSKESLITGEIYNIIGSYTLEQAQANKDLMREDILNRVQEMFDSDFIFQVSFSDIIFQ